MPAYTETRQSAGWQSATIWPATPTSLMSITTEAAVKLNKAECVSCQSLISLLCHCTVGKLGSDGLISIPRFQGEIVEVSIICYVICVSCLIVVFCHNTWPTKVFHCAWMHSLPPTCLTLDLKYNIVFYFQRQSFPIKVCILHLECIHLHNGL